MVWKWVRDALSDGILGVSPLFTESLAYAGVMMGQQEAQGGPSIPTVGTAKGCPELMGLGEAASASHGKEAMETNCDML